MRFDSYEDASWHNDTMPMKGNIMSTLSVRQIVAERLREIGADGLCRDDYGCSCCIEDLAPCSIWQENAFGCLAAKSRSMTEDEHEYWGVYADDAPVIYVPMEVEK